MRSAAILGATLLVSMPALGADLWLHLRSESQNGRRNRVVINLPVRALEKALPMIPREVSRNCELRFSEVRITPGELRAVVQQLRVAPSGAEVRLTPDDTELAFRREGDVLQISGTSHWRRGLNGTVRVPFDLAEALLGGEGDLDFRAAVELLVRRGAGEIVLINHEDHNVRIWVDQSATAPLKSGRTAP
ncbi:MAG TPA: hypothetical protein VMS12_03685 [Thermoanaerobaculia bacterium]|nr:hypothetical protein [Thermoanaerobaculia bacterium]